MQSDINKTSVNKTSRSTTAPPARRRRPPTERESSFEWRLWSRESAQANIRTKFIKENVRLFGIGEQNFDVKRKRSQWIGMDSVTDICRVSLPVLCDHNTGQGNLRSPGKKDRWPDEGS